MKIDGVEIQARGFNPGRDELREYVKYVKARAGEVNSIFVAKCDDGLINVHWTKHNLPFERIRRITGYLTGNLKTWNSSKQAEEKDRVKHVETII